MSVLFTLAARVCLCRRRFARVVASMAASPLLAVDVEMVRRASATHALRLIWGRGRDFENYFAGAGEKTQIPYALPTKLARDTSGTNTNRSQSVSVNFMRF